MNNLKTYVKPDGYKIMVSEKAYHLFYEKQGFKPAEEVAAPSADGTAAAASEAGEAADAGAADTAKKTASRSKKASAGEE